MPKLKRKSVDQRQEENTSYKRIKRDASQNDNNIINNTNDDVDNVNEEKSLLSGRARQQKYLLNAHNLNLHKERMQTYRSSPEYKEKNKTYQKDRLTEDLNYKNHLACLKLTQSKRLQDPTNRKNHQEKAKINQNKRLQDPTNRKNHQEKAKINQNKRLQDPINRKNHQEKAKINQNKRLQDPINRKSHQEKLKINQNKRLQDLINRKNHQEKLKVNQTKRLQDSINRKNHQEKLKVNQTKRLQNPINRRNHQEKLKLNQNKRLIDSKNRRIHRERNKDCQNKRLMSEDKKTQHIEKNKYCQKKRLCITNKREIFNNKLSINQKQRLKNEELRKIHIKRVLESRVLKKSKVEDLQRNVLFDKFNLLKLEGPTYECSSCCRLWFKSSLKFFKTSDFKDCDLSQIHLICKMIDKSTIGLLCSSCERAIKNNKIPSLSLYYKELQFPKVADEILNLTELEERFVCPRIPFMMIRAIINDGQYFVKGRAVNVPSNVETSVSILPRVQSEAMIIPICFRRKKSFKSNVMFENVRPQIIKKAALILRNSEVYKHCKIKLDFQRKTNNPDSNNDKYFAENINNVDDIDYNSSDENSEDEEPVNVEDESTLLLTQAIVFAPGEGQVPVSLFDEYAEALSFIKIYGGKLIKKPEHITYQNWIKSEIMRSDRRCATIIKLFFSALKLRTSKIASGINFCLRKNKIQSKLMRAVDMLDDNNVKYMELNDSGFKFLSHDRGSPSFWEQKKKNVFALFRQIGPPSMFFTLSAAETKWLELIVMLKKVVDGEKITLEQAEKMDYKEKARLISSDPVTIARYFDYRIRELFKVMKENNSIFREHNIIDFYYRIEFQQRGSPHIHCLLWLKKAPCYNDEEENNSQVIEFIDKFITCSNKLISKELIKLQTHKHTFTCKKGKKKTRCRFDIPFFPMVKTCILKPLSTIENERKNELRKIREDIQKFLGESFKNESIISIKQILEKFRITYDTYIEIIRSSLNRPTVMLRRNPDECMINFYNQELLQLHSANMDIQFILDMYSCASYVLNYLNKSISGLSRLMYDVTNEVKRGNYTMKEQLRLIANAFLKASEFGSQEAVYYILALPLSKCSREVVFVNTNLPESRIQVVKSKEDLEKLPSNSTDIYIKDTLDHYMNRPYELETICLASFVSWYNYSTKEYYSKNKISSDDESGEDHCIDNSISLKLIDNSGFVRKRKKSKVLRFINYNEQTDRDNFIRENVMLFLPWRNEDILIKSASSLFSKNQNLIKERRSEYVYNENIENILKEATQKVIDFDDGDESEGNTPKNLEVFDDPTCEGDIAIDMKESEIENRKCDDKDIYYVSIPRLILEEDFMNLVCFLNEKQRKFLLHLLHRFKTKLLPLYHCVLGGAGVGKSRLIEAIYQTMLRFFHFASNNLESTKVLLCAPTGKAAFGIKGTTLHATFILPLNQCSTDLVPLSSGTRNTLYAKLKDLSLIIIDEISMVGSRMIQQVDSRLKQIFQTSKPFGGISVIVFGDFNQLAPVGDRYIFEAHSMDLYGDIIGNPLWNLFTSYQLTEIMRQKNDIEFAEALNNLAGGKLSKNDINLFESRIVNNNDDIPEDAIHLFRTNAEVDKYNEEIILKDNLRKNITANDKIIGKCSEVMKKNLINYCKTIETKDAKGLPSNLSLSIGVKYMMTINIDVEDGLVNGAVGTLKGYELDNNKEIFRLWLDFSDDQIGKKRRKEIRKDGQENWTAIDKIVKNIQPTKKIVTIIRKQFPLVPAEAITIYKSQGGTYNTVVIHLTKGMRKNELYVAFSRCTKLIGLFIIGDLKIPLHQNPYDKVQIEVKRLLRVKLLLSCYFIDNLESETLIYQNIQSLREKSHWLEFTNFMKLYKPCIFIAAETWIKIEDDIFIPDYEIVHRVNVANTRGRHAYGLVIYCRKDKKFSIHYNYNNEEKFQSCSLVTGVYNDIAICTGYKSPSTNYTSIKKNIEEMISIAERNCKKIIFLGDFNINLNSGSPHSFFKLLNSRQLHSMLKTSDATTNSSTTIDIIFSNFQLNCGITEIIFGYHKQLTCILNEKILDVEEKNDNQNEHELTLNEVINEGKWLRKKLLEKKIIEKDFEMINKIHKFFKEKIYIHKNYKKYNKNSFKIPTSLQNNFFALDIREKSNNSFYYAISILISGGEELMPCLRVLEAIHFALNQKFMKEISNGLFQKISFENIINEQRAEIGNVILISAILQRPINIITQSKLLSRRIFPVDNREQFYLYFDSNSKHYIPLIKKFKEYDDTSLTIKLEINFSNFIQSLDNRINVNKLLESIKLNSGTNNNRRLSTTREVFDENINRKNKCNKEQNIKDNQQKTESTIIFQSILIDIKKSQTLQEIESLLHQNKNLLSQLSSEIYRIIEKNTTEKFMNYSISRNYLKFNLKTHNLSIKNSQFNSILNETFQLTDVAGDGNCLFRSFSELVFYDQERYKEIKLFIINFIIYHKDKYELLLTKHAFSVKDENCLLIMDPKLDDLLRMISREGAWGNEGSIHAMSDALNIIIIMILVRKETHEKRCIFKYSPTIKHSIIPFTIINEIDWHFIPAHRKLESSTFHGETWQDVRMYEIKVDSNNTHFNVSVRNNRQQNKTDDQPINSNIFNSTVDTTRIISDIFNNQEIFKSIVDSITQKAQLIADQIHYCKSLSEILNITQENQNVILEINDNIKNKFEIYLKEVSEKIWTRKEKIKEKRFPNFILNNFFLDNVDNDGNCLFRALAEIILNDEKRYYEIKIFVIYQVTINLTFYEKMCKEGEIEVRTTNNKEGILESPNVDDFLRMVAADKIWGNEGTLYVVSHGLQTKIFLFEVCGYSQKLVSLVTINLAPENTLKVLTIIRENGNHYLVCRYRNKNINFSQYIEEISRIEGLSLTDYNMDDLKRNYFSS